MRLKKQRASAMVASEVLGPLSHPTRLLIICLLLERERNAGELVTLLGTTKGNISQHLRLLHLRGLIADRREGTHIHYRIADPRLKKLVKTLQGLWCPGLISA